MAAFDQSMIKLYKICVFSYNLVMYVAIAVDSGSAERARELADLLAQYGFKMIQRGLWESATVSDDTLNRIKRDLDKATDAFDKLRFFQFPMEGTLVLSSLREKKWRRMVARDVETVKVRTVYRAEPKGPPAGPPAAMDTGRRRAKQDRRK